MCPEHTPDMSAPPTILILVLLPGVSSGSWPFSIHFSIAPISVLPSISVDSVHIAFAKSSCFLNSEIISTFPDFLKLFVHNSL